jgi:hypothetical protein
MPKLKRTVSDEMLLGAGVHELDPDLGIIAKQVELLLNRSKTRVDGDRRDGKPPPPYKDGGKILYRLGGVLEERARVQGMTLAQAARARADAIRGWEAPTFAGFLATAGLRDPWPIATVHGCPVNALTSLGQPVADIRWLTLGEYLQGRLDAALARDRREQLAALEAAVGQGVPGRRAL